MELEHYDVFEKERRIRSGDEIRMSSFQTYDLAPHVTSHSSPRLIIYIQTKEQLGPKQLCGRVRWRPNISGLLAKAQTG